MSLPVKVPTNQFQEWDKQISRFIWNGKKPRIKYSTLTVSRDGGGMSLPNLRDYYYAQLRIIVGWCDNGYEAKWKEMESECKGVPVQAMIGDFKLMSNYEDHLNPISLFTLYTWFEVIKQLNLWTQLKTLRWLGYDTEFKPNSLDSRFRYWANQGITAYCTMIEKNTLHNFQMLKRKYNLQNYDFYRYLQLRQYYLKEIRKKLSNYRTKRHDTAGDTGIHCRD